MPLTEPTRLVLAKTYVGTDDPDAAAYIAAVEAADEAASPGVGALETATKVAIHSFVKGCKADGIWSAFRVAGITCAARTSAGALIPLIGTAPILVGMTSSNYTRRGFTQSQNNHGLSIAQNISSDATSTNNHYCAYLDSYASTDSFMSILGFSGSFSYFMDATRIYNSGLVSLPNNAQIGLFGSARTGNTSIEYYRNPNEYGVVSNQTSLVNFPSSAFQIGISVANNSGRNRYSFYSAGTYLDLRLLNARVTTLINAFGAAIP